MPSFKLTVKAKADLRKIASYTRQQWGKEQRNRYLLQLDECFYQLADNASIREACEYIKPCYRKFPQGSRLIFYRIGKNSPIEIIRVLHKNMDVRSNIL